MALIYAWGGSALLDYMAVVDGCRGRGIGGSMFREPAGRMAGRVLLPEIERPSSGWQARRRERFYRGLGAAVIPDTYLMPSYGGVRPSAMLLLGVSTSGGRASCSRGWAAAAMRRIYRDVYGGADTRLLHDSLAGVPDSFVLEPVRQPAV